VQVLKGKQKMTQKHYLKTGGSLFFEGQLLHIGALVVLLGAAHFISQSPDFVHGELWRINSRTWFFLSLLIPIIHQVYVWVCWRWELHWQLLSRILGHRIFKIYSILFSFIGVARVGVVLMLAISNTGTFNHNTTFLKIAAVLVLLPALYLFYSVKRYFTATRAFGADHFDEAYRTRSFEKRGIFRFTRNGMYIYGFLIFWVPGLWFASSAALAAALFNHIYIWVHYFATEKPDMRHIYK
jgi:protein-S-isoprenylcysteine O-methyltransferase Ste14